MFVSSEQCVGNRLLVNGWRDKIGLVWARLADDRALIDEIMWTFLQTVEDQTFFIVVGAQVAQVIVPWIDFAQLDPHVPDAMFRVPVEWQSVHSRDSAAHADWERSQTIPLIAGHCTDFDVPCKATYVQADSSLITLRLSTRSIHRSCNILQFWETAGWELANRSVMPCPESVDF